MRRKLLKIVAILLMAGSGYARPQKIDSRGDLQPEVESYDGWTPVPSPVRARSEDVPEVIESDSRYRGEIKNGEKTDNHSYEMHNDFKALSNPRDYTVKNGSVGSRIPGGSMRENERVDEKVSAGERKSRRIFLKIIPSKDKGKPVEFLSGDLTGQKLHSKRNNNDFSGVFGSGYSYDIYGDSMVQGDGGDDRKRGLEELGLEKVDEVAADKWKPLPVLNKTGSNFSGNGNQHVNFGGLGLKDLKTLRLEEVHPKRSGGSFNEFPGAFKLSAILGNAENKVKNNDRNNEDSAEENADGFMRIRIGEIFSNINLGSDARAKESREKNRHSASENSKNASRLNGASKSKVSSKSVLNAAKSPELRNSTSIKSENSTKKNVRQKPNFSQENHKDKENSKNSVQFGALKQQNEFINDPEQKNSTIKPQAAVNSMKNQIRMKTSALSSLQLNPNTADQTQSEKSAKSKVRLKPSSSEKLPSLELKNWPNEGVQSLQDLLNYEKYTSFHSADAVPNAESFVKNPVVDEISSVKPRPDRPILVFENYPPPKTPSWNNAPGVITVYDPERPENPQPDVQKIVQWLQIPAFGTSQNPVVVEDVEKPEFSDFETNEPTSSTGIHIHSQLNNYETDLGSYGYIDETHSQGHEHFGSHEGIQKPVPSEYETLFADLQPNEPLSTTGVYTHSKNSSNSSQNDHENNLGNYGYVDDTSSQGHDHEGIRKPVPSEYGPLFEQSSSTQDANSYNSPQNNHETNLGNYGYVDDTSSQGHDQIQKPVQGEHGTLFEPSTSIQETNSYNSPQNNHETNLENYGYVDDTSSQGHDQIPKPVPGEHGTLFEPSTSIQETNSYDSPLDDYETSFQEQEVPEDPNAGAPQIEDNNPNQSPADNTGSFGHYQDLQNSLSPILHGPPTYKPNGEKKPYHNPTSVVQQNTVVHILNAGQKRPGVTVTETKAPDSGKLPPKNSSRPGAPANLHITFTSQKDEASQASPASSQGPQQDPVPEVIYSENINCPTITISSFTKVNNTIQGKEGCTDLNIIINSHILNTNVFKPNPGDGDAPADEKDAGGSLVVPQSVPGYGAPEGLQDDVSYDYLETGEAQSAQDDEPSLSTFEVFQGTQISLENVGAQDNVVQGTGLQDAPGGTAQDVGPAPAEPEAAPPGGSSGLPSFGNPLPGLAGSPGQQTGSGGPLANAGAAEQDLGPAVAQADAAVPGGSSGLPSFGNPLPGLAGSPGQQTGSGGPLANAGGAEQGLGSAVAQADAAVPGGSSGLPSFGNPLPGLAGSLGQQTGSGGATAGSGQTQTLDDDDDDDDFDMTPVGLMESMSSVFAYFTFLNPLNYGLFSIAMAPLAVLAAGVFGVAALMFPWAFPDVLDFGRAADEVTIRFRPNLEEVVKHSIKKYKHWNEWKSKRKKRKR